MSPACKGILFRKKTENTVLVICHHIAYIKFIWKKWNIAAVSYTHLDVYKRQAVGGSMMGIVGMLIFIPLCSVLYALLRDGVNMRLGKKGGGTAVCEASCGPVGEKDGDQGQQE